MQQNRLQWHLWSLLSTLGTELVFSQAGIALGMDAACIQEQGRAGDSSQEPLLQLQAGRGQLYLAAAHSLLITLQQNTSSLSLQTVCHFGNETTSRLSVLCQRLRKSCLRLNLNINVVTHSPLFCSRFCCSARRGECNEICTLQNWRVGCWFLQTEACWEVGHRAVSTGTTGENFLHETISMILSFSILNTEPKLKFNLTLWADKRASNQETYLSHQHILQSSSIFLQELQLKHFSRGTSLCCTLFFSTLSFCLLDKIPLSQDWR